MIFFIVAQHATVTAGCIRKPTVKFPLVAFPGAHYNNSSHIMNRPATPKKNFDKNWSSSNCGVPRGAET